MTHLSICPDDYISYIHYDNAILGYSGAWVLDGLTEYNNQEIISDSSSYTPLSTQAYACAAASFTPGPAHHERWEGHMSFPIFRCPIV